MLKDDIKKLYCRKRLKKVSGEDCIKCYLNNKSGFYLHDDCKKYNLEEKVIKNDIK